MYKWEIYLITLIFIIALPLVMVRFLRSDPPFKEATTSMENKPETENNPQQPIDQNLLLPDLKVAPLSEAYIQTGLGGSRIVRFPATFINVGDGPLEMIGAYDSQTNTTQATQRIYGKDGSQTERLIGNFVFHPSHGHWHFENFVEFEIYTLGENDSLDQKVATTGKMTFCVHDYAPLDEVLANKPERAVYPRCVSDVQGISVGWADTYEANIKGQEVEISHLPDGRYAFHSVVDPENRVLEKDESNNSNATYIEIQGNNVQIISKP